MEKTLNQKIEEEIKAKISDKSAFTCKDETITDVSRLTLNLNEDYAQNMPERVLFNGNARFEFEPKVKNLVENSAICHFSGYATIQDFHVVKVDKPIRIEKGI